MSNQNDIIAWRNVKKYIIYNIHWVSHYCCLLMMACWTRCGLLSNILATTMSTTILSSLQSIWNLCQSACQLYTYLLPYLNEASQQCVCVNNSCVDSAFRSTINGPMKELMHIQCTSFCPCIINMRNFDKIIKGSFWHPSRPVQK